MNEDRAMILTLNSGSSSIKFTLFPATGEIQSSTALCHGQIEGLGDDPRLIAVDSAINTVTSAS